MAEYLIQSETLDDIADAINEKLDTPVGAMTPAQMVTAIGSISTGGGSATIPYFISVEEYTHAENWTSDTLGNTLNFCKTYFDYDNHPANFQIAYVSNNTASNYKASVLWMYKSSASGSSGGGGFSNNYPNRQITGTASFWITAGSKITVLTLAPTNRDSGLEV